jgi:predicted Ser/Thr protein kinase
LALTILYSSPQENFIGKGGFGAVYRGSWNKNDVAVKVIQRQEEDNLREFWKFVNEYQVSG